MQHSSSAVALSTLLHTLMLHSRLVFSQELELVKSLLMSGNEDFVAQARLKIKASAARTPTAGAATTASSAALHPQCSARFLVA